MEFIEKCVILCDPDLITDAFADAIVSVYESPMVLHLAYKKCQTEEEKENMIYNAVTAPPINVTGISDDPEFHKLIATLKQQLKESQQKKLKKISETIYKQLYGIEDT